MREDAVDVGEDAQALRRESLDGRGLDTGPGTGGGADTLERAHHAMHLDAQLGDAGGADFSTRFRERRAAMLERRAGGVGDAGDRLHDASLIIGATSAPPAATNARSSRALSMSASTPPAKMSAFAHHRQ